jgi:hypothetical protein
MPLVAGVGHRDGRPPLPGENALVDDAGKKAEEKREVERKILADLGQHWGARALHIWDRGFASNPWLTLAFVYAVCFVMRWPKRYCLLDSERQEHKA